MNDFDTNSFKWDSRRQLESEIRGLQEKITQYVSWQPIKYIVKADALPEGQSITDFLKDWQRFGIITPLLEPQETPIEKVDFRINVEYLNNLTLLLREAQDRLYGLLHPQVDGYSIQHQDNPSPATYGTLEITDTTTLITEQLGIPHYNNPPSTEQLIPTPDYNK